jgi:hypothetical protein
MAEITDVPQVIKEIGPTLFLGLGGTGAEVIARLKHKFELFYGETKREELKLIQYLVLDTAEYEKLSKTVKDHTDADRDFLYLGGFNGAEYIRNQYPLDEDLRGWWDNRCVLPEELIDDGASRIRQLGRLCLYRNREEFITRMRTKIRDTYNLENQLLAQGRLKGKSQTCNVYIVTGSCGGTGSGAFMDISLLVWEAVGAIFGFPPQMVCLIFLPFIYAEKGREISSILEKLLQANGYAFFEEMEYFLKYPLRINDYCFDSQARRRQKVAPVAGWRPFNQAYLIDNQIPSVGLIREMENLYTYVSKALFQLYVTPEENYHAQVWTNIKGTLYNGIDAIYGKPTAFSSLGLSTLEYPRERILTYLCAKYMHDVLANGFLKKGDWMEKAALLEAQGDVKEGKKGWAALLGGDQENELSGQFAKEIASRMSGAPTVESFQDEKGAYDHDGLIEMLRAQITAAEKAIEAGAERLKQIYNGFVEGAKSAILAQIDSFVDSCKDGIHYAKDVIIQTDNLLTQRLSSVRAEIHQKTSSLETRKREISSSDSEVEGSIASVDAAQNKLFGKKEALSEALEAYVGKVRSILQIGLELEAAKLRERFLIEVTGEPTGGKLTAVQTKGVTSGYKVQLSILDQWTADLGAMETDIGKLALEAEYMMKLGKYYTTTGKELTTTYLPEIASVELIAEKKEIQAMYSKQVVDDKTGEAQEILNRWNNDASIEKKLHHLKDDKAVLRSLKSLLHQRAHQLFARETQKSILELIEKEAQEEQARLYNNVDRLSIPCCSVNLSRLKEDDRSALTTIWSMGSETDLREKLPGKSAGRLAWAETGAEQISVMACQHGFPLFAVEGMSQLYPAYHALDKNRNFPHIRYPWNSEEGVHIDDNEEDMMTTMLVSHDARLYFAMGLFIDDLIKEKKELFEELFWIEEADRIFDNLQPRGYVYIKEGYNALEIEAMESEGERRFRMKKSTVRLGKEREEALQEFHKRQLLIDSGKMFVNALLQKIGDENFALYVERYQGKLLDVHKKQKMPPQKAFIRSLWQALDSFKKDITKPEEEEIV